MTELRNKKFSMVLVSLSLLILIYPFVIFSLRFSYLAMGIASIILSFLIILLLYSLYIWVKKLEKGKLLLKVKSSPLDAMGKKNKKYFYIVCTIMAISVGVIAYISFSSFQYFLPLAVMLILFPITFKIKGNYEFYEKGIRFRARFIPWEDFKSYKKEGNEIVLIADIKHFWEKLWKGNLYFEDKNSKIEKVVEKMIK